jgi:CheY-like chemotaxis protein
LDNLARDLPHVDHVSLVVAWFGTDLRAGQCRIEPRVDQRFKPTRPRAWQVAGLSRGNANLVSSVDGRPAYGGTPEDLSVIEAIQEVKARGHQVTLNPFVMMDVPAGNSLPNPQGGVGQPAYPWRGRITCVAGSPNMESQIAAFFGTASANHFSLRGQEPNYSGPAEWSYRRFILHQAMLAKAAGGVESFLIGSELVGLTHVRASTGQFPAVAALKALAAQVRLILGPQVKIGYAADWTEYGGYHPPGSQDLCFPLDPLWADANLDFIGLDWYPPLTDRRPGEPEADLAALQAGIEGGEGYDFYYASEADRAARTRTPITDGAYQEPWVWRVKDIRSFWSQTHYERIGGQRLSTPTPWVPQSKPIRLMELGFPAVDKAANRPSVFPDPKSSEAGLPPFSTGSRDDGEQRLALEASLSYWRDHSPISALDGRPMIALEHIFLWTWDARPYPHFPHLQAVWGDGAHAATGHWLAGRAGVLPVRELLVGIGARAGLSLLNPDAVSGYVEGYVVENPATARALIESLLLPLGLEARPRFDGLEIVEILPPEPVCALAASDFQIKDGAADVARIVQSQEAPAHIQVTTYASERDYEPSTYQADGPGTRGGTSSVSLPIVVNAESRQAIAHQLATAAPLERLQGKLSPYIAATLEVGDRFAWENGNFWRVDRLEGPWAQELVATPAPQPRLTPLASHAMQAEPALPWLAAPPDLVVLDLPAPFTQIQAPKPVIGAFARPWPGTIDVRLAEQIVARIDRPMIYGRLAEALPAAPISRRLASGCVVVFATSDAPPASGKAALYGPEGVADILSWTDAKWVANQTWHLEGVVRGYHGGAIGPALPVDTGFVLLDDALVPADFDPGLLGLKLDWTAAPSASPELETQLQASFGGSAALPWSPCHLRARRAVSGIQFSWVRRASGDGDSWALPDVPHGAATESYVVVVKSSTGATLRTIDVYGPAYLYPASDELADFGAVQSEISVSICQRGPVGRLGYRLEQRISVQHNG